MPGIVRKNWLLVVVGGCLLLLMAAQAYLQSEKDKGNGNPSSYSTLSHGGKAAFLMLEQSGYPVERWDKSPIELPADGADTLLIVADPIEYPSQREALALSRFLRNGGSILATGPLPESFLPKGAVSTDSQRFESQECKPAAPTRLTRGGSISMDGYSNWNGKSYRAMVHFVDAKDNAVVVSYPVGKGSVMWWASAWPLENAGIREKNNLELLLNSTAGYKHVLWDEYFRNERESKGEESVRAYSWGLGQLALIAVWGVVTYSRRSGPLVALRPPSRRSPLEFVETLASVFRRAKSTQVAVEIAFQRFRQVAARRLGIRGTSNAAEIVEAMEQRGVRIAEPTAVLVRNSENAVDDATLTEKTAMEYVRALNEASQAMDPTQAATKDNARNS